MTAAPIKPVVWLGDALRALRTFPSGVQDEVGYVRAPRHRDHLFHAIVITRSTAS